MKETAVEWLFEKLWNTDKDKFTWHTILKQAKEMEKENIKNAWLNSLTKGDFNSADEYYNYLYTEQ